MGVRIDVRGDYACFTRPEMKVERVSYDMMTPSAARGVLSAIYWHPGIEWHIDAISVHSPIRFSSIRRNEVKAVASARNVFSVMKKGRGNLFISASDNIVQRSSLLLRNVHYVIDAHFEPANHSEVNMNDAKVISIVTRRLEKGQCFHQPSLGCREFPAIVTPCLERPPCPAELKGERDLGWMFYGMDWQAYDRSTDLERTPNPLFFRAVLHDGVLKVPLRNSGEVVG